MTFDPVSGSAGGQCSYDCGLKQPTGFTCWSKIIFEGSTNYKGLNF